MSLRTVYLDSSAILKLLAPEVETAALIAYLAQRPRLVSSALARVETHRAIWRAGGSHAARKRADEALARIALIRIDESILERAAELTSPDLRTLDAVHLATALFIGPELTELVTYDRRLAEAAVAAGLEVVAPR